MKIIDIFEHMTRLGLTGSQVEFSTIWLGRSARYYSHLIARNCEPGLATLCGIKIRIERTLTYPSAYGNPALLELKQRICDEIKRRAITDIRNHRL